MSNDKAYNDKAYVDDVLEAMRDVIAFLGDMTYDAFVADEKTAAAIYWKLEIIGEATKRLSNALRDAHPEIPWKKMAGMRDKLIHGYDEIELVQVYNAVTEVIPPLIPIIEAILVSLPDPE